MTVATRKAASDIPAWPFYLAIVTYFSLQILWRVLLSPTLDYDEAEQAMLAQWLLPGYTEQPPLYTWLQHGLFSLLGHSVLAVALLKNVLLFFTYLFVFLAARQTLRTNRAAMLAAFSLLLIPQIGWESQRDMTHTVLLVCAAAATLWLMLGLLQRQLWSSYCFLGVCIAVGIMAKANYLVFLTVLLLAFATSATGRRVLCNRRAAAALALALMLSGPYLYWLVHHLDIFLATTGKFKQGKEYFYFKGPFSLLKNSILFLGPLLLAFTAIFPTGWRRMKSAGQRSIEERLLTRYFAILVPALLVIILLFEVTYVKDRWLQPLLFVVPILLFARLDQNDISPRRRTWYLTTIAVAAVAVYLALVIRVVGAERMAKFCRLNYPIAAIAEQLERDGFDHGLIVSDDRFLAGNLSLAFPDSVAIIPGYGFAALAPPASRLAVVWKVSQNNQDVPKILQDFLKTHFGSTPDTLPIDTVTARYLYSENATVTFAIILLSSPPGQ